VVARLSIGEFAMMTRLSRKALRHYHELGLLEPAQTDPATGYRFYDTSQMQTAQIIRRLRGLDMPVPDVRSVLLAPDVGARSQIIAAHLVRMEAQLADTQQAVAGLRELLTPSPEPIAVELRRTPATRVAAISESVALQGIGPWFSQAVDEIWAVLYGAGVAATGPSGGLYAAELFTDESGEATVFVPCAEPVTAGRVHPLTLPAGEWAVTVHIGSHSSLDRTHAALGSYVTERLVAVDGRVQENYLPDGPDGLARTEICWPVFQTSAG
jgi:DNA-binding transcriptional MerR regulator